MCISQQKAKATVCKRWPKNRPHGQKAQVNCSMTTQATTAAVGGKSNGGTIVLHDAKYIPLKHQRLENDIIPLGDMRVEVILAEVDVDDLKLDPANPRISFKLKGAGLTSTATPQQLEDLLWHDEDVKKLKRSIELNQGLIEPIIVSGKDGTVLEGNCRLTCYRKLRAETESKEPLWTKVRARILPASVERATVDTLLGELHVAGKNQWTPFEQAAHLYRMNENKGVSEGKLAEQYRISKSYVNNKIRAYRLMTEVFVPRAEETGKAQGEDLSRRWSYFEEFYKGKTRPTAEGKTPKEPRVYDGEDLEHKFCDWILDGKLPIAEDVRRLGDILGDKDAIAEFEKNGIDKGYSVFAAHRPERSSKLWKEVATMSMYLQKLGFDEINELRSGSNPSKRAMFDDLVKAVEHIKSEITK